MFCHNLPDEHPVDGHRLQSHLRCEGNAYVAGLGKMFLHGVTIGALNGTIPDSLFMVFQMTFAIITPALIVGAFADRMKFSAMLWFTGLRLVVIYTPVTNWVWGGGFLRSRLRRWHRGPHQCQHRGTGRSDDGGKRTGLGTKILAPHNLMLSVIDAALLWVGWVRFKAESALAAMAMVVTQIATAAAALAWMFLKWMLRGNPSVLGILSGAVDGLVASAPAAGFVTPVGAHCLSVPAGFACNWGATWPKHKPAMATRWMSLAFTVSAALPVRS